MAITPNDVRIEQRSYQEERRELKELDNAAELLYGVLESVLKECPIVGNKKIYEILDATGSCRKWQTQLDKAAREIRNARMHHQRIRALAKRLCNDLKDIRQPEKKQQIRGFLTKMEAEVLERCNNLKFVIDEALAKTNQASGYLSENESSIRGAAHDIQIAYNTVVRAYDLIKELKHIEAQVEEATKAYVNA
ncbi:hypothetical protein HYW19_00235 [Candidatus Woesearchaeota archaeon]|nr:hypothetical protein [Candidatus Woesearchaeota archaeon]